jgi:hypothetical protein
MKRAALSALFYYLLISLSLSAPVETEKKELASPDGRLVAEILSRMADFTEDTVKIITKESGSYAEFPMTSPTGANGRNVLKGEWSPDSKFFVFSTFSSGGHSGWNFRTFVYAVDANTFAAVDEKVRPVTSKDFKLLPAHTLQVDTLNPLGID